jgi:hypothetical protein
MSDDPRPFELQESVSRDLFRIAKRRPFRPQRAPWSRLGRLVVGASVPWFLGLMILPRLVSIATGHNASDTSVSLPPALVLLALAPFVLMGLATYVGPKDILQLLFVWPSPRITLDVHGLQIDPGGRSPPTTFAWPEVGYLAGPSLTGKWTVMSPSGKPLGEVRGRFDCPVDEATGAPVDLPWLVSVLADEARAVPLA